MRLPAVILILVLGIFQSAPALKIVVLEGEGGVNIVQQKTAVRPLIEVRDRNNVPVAGATVTFSIGGGSHAAAFAGGVQTLSVTTNAAGQAAATSLNALSSGAFQIQVSAAYQGQIATAAISQTNFATAAAAAQAGASAGTGGASGGAAGGGAAGGGGGISGTTIGIVGGAVAAGAVAATQVVGKDSDATSSNNESAFDGYDGALSGQVVATSHFIPSIGPPTDCAFTRSITGTIRMELATGNATGRATLSMVQSPLSFTGNCTSDSGQITFTVQRENAPVSGGPSALSFSATAPVGIEVYALKFLGALSGRTINGKLTMDISSPGGSNPTHGGSTELVVTLSR